MCAVEIIDAINAMLRHRHCFHREGCLNLLRKETPLCLVFDLFSTRFGKDMMAK